MQTANVAALQRLYVVNAVLLAGDLLQHFREVVLAFNLGVVRLRQPRRGALFLGRNAPHCFGDIPRLMPLGSATNR